ncbi:hypothetical protein KL928_000143 [Ogataea angusta]|uniref:DNA repair and recombination protein RAD26 n=1 Tax=Pichia angusta TaxID=870730 RepID=A0AAN6DIU3_PICAN|nr:uncharacterized protein KL928_000143 [Ogataea angusta]KAG7821668.1 hypothetical protein KL928_000143 [Ogataea angusta]
MESSSGPSGERELESLGVRLMAQDSLEKEVAEDANKMMIEREIELDQKRLEKAKEKQSKLQGRLRGMELRANNSGTRISEKQRLKADIDRLKREELQPLEVDIKEIEARLRDNQNSTNKLQAEGGSEMLPGETQQEYLVRTGKVTAFGTSNGFIEEDETGVKNHQDLIIPGIELADEDEDDEDALVRKRKRDENLDDGDERMYRDRLRRWTERRASLRAELRPDYTDDPQVPEWQKPHPNNADAILNDEFRVPGDIYPSLFDYQRTGVQWLWELYSHKTGGIIGDEMGLGKTVQVISFLAGLHYSGKLTKPVLVVCPATVLSQWCKEFHRWWPALRVVILHSIGTGMTGKRVEEFDDEDDADLNNLPSDGRAKELVDSVINNGHVIITTYVGVRIYSRYLLPVRWNYVVLDEGHKIRNPDSHVTLACKQLKTPNRIILSGTPIQNNLVELWSLFDFVFPGRLGTLPVFQKQFCVPINIGGYANATNVQVQTGYKCAVILRDLISPYLLRRVKADVAKDLPKKSEMVLFCKLTDVQRKLYEDFLNSEDINKILRGKRNALFGIDVLRKICNHPDLVDLKLRKKHSRTAEQLEARAGKLQVVHALLDVWFSEGRKTLIFTQTRQMLDILQDFMEALNYETESKFSFMRMDGTTPISQRQSMVDQFNTNPMYNVFLLTTRVGGLGVNLTGASRVIIYDPDWNPSTDVQARERAWRLGQKKDVVIYRLMMAGSIEEKIYHRQIFKQLLTNKILKDPKQKRFFKMNDLHELFTLAEGETKFNNSRNTKKNDDDFLQVSKLKGVSGLQKYEDGEDEEGHTEDKDIMAGLIGNNALHSALEHESVLNPSSSYSLIDNEASRIANEAVKALRESRKLARQARINVPTWTGKFGEAGRTVGRPRKPGPSGSSTPTGRSQSPMVSSSSILDNIKKRKDSSPKPKIEDTDLIARLSNYMAGLEGFFSTSAAVLDELKIDVSNEKTVKVVRSMLKSICKWDKERKGWVLNEEFR